MTDLLFFSPMEVKNVVKEMEAKTMKGLFPQTVILVS